MLLPFAVFVFSTTTAALIIAALVVTATGLVAITAFTVAIVAAAASAAATATIAGFFGCLQKELAVIDRLVVPAHVTPLKKRFGAFRSVGNIGELDIEHGPAVDMRGFEPIRLNFFAIKRCNDLSFSHFRDKERYIAVLNGLSFFINDFTFCLDVIRVIRERSRSQQQENRQQDTSHLKSPLT